MNNWIQKDKDEWKHKQKDTVIQVHKIKNKDYKYGVFTTMDLKNYPKSHKGKYYGNIFKTKKSAMLQAKRLMKIN